MATGSSAEEVDAEAANSNGGKGTPKPKDDHTHPVTGG